MVVHMFMAIPGNNHKKKAWRGDFQAHGIAHLRMGATMHWKGNSK